MKDAWPRFFKRPTRILTEAITLVKVPAMQQTVPGILSGSVQQFEVALRNTLVQACGCRQPRPRSLSGGISRGCLTQRAPWIGARA